MALVAIEHSYLRMLQHVCFVTVAHDVAVSEETLLLLTLPCSSVSRAVFASVHPVCSFFSGVTVSMVATEQNRLESAERRVRQGR